MHACMHVCMYVSLCVYVCIVALTIANTSSKIDVGNLNPSWEVAKNITHGDGANFKGLNLMLKH